MMELTYCSDASRGDDLRIDATVRWIRLPFLKLILDSLMLEDLKYRDDDDDYDAILNELVEIWNQLF